MPGVCFMTDGCVWDFNGMGGECIPDEGKGDICENIPLQFCDQVPGCEVDRDECVPSEP